MSAVTEANEALWRDVAELWMSTSLGEIPREEGLVALLDRIAHHLGMACAIVDRRGVTRMRSRDAEGRLLAYGARTSHALEDPFGRPSGTTLVFYGEPPVLVGDRLARAVSTLLDASSRSSSQIHRLKNKLMALLVNVELVGDIVKDADPDRPLSEIDHSERERALEAIAFSVRTVRELVELLERPGA